MRSTCKFGHGWIIASAVGITAVTGACGSDSTNQAAPAPAADAGPPSAQGVLDAIPAIGSGTMQVAMQTIATGFTAPLLGTTAPGVAGQLFVVDQVGLVMRVDRTTGVKSTFLDARALLVPLGIAALGGYDERGLLGLAFHPLFAQNGLFYTVTSEPVSGTADFTFPKLGANCPTPPPNLDPDHQNVLREWHVAQPTNLQALPDAGSRIVLRVDWANYNHNGGMIAFGPDGMLFLSLGDGGGEDDQTCQLNAGNTKVTIGHAATGNAPDPTLAYGKMFRIDPTARNSVNGAYGVPADNPFVGRTGTLPEIYASGLRNFWRFSFDAPTGALIGADTGENDVEEVDVIRAGGDYGWPRKEGDALFDPAGFALTMGGATDGVATTLSPGVPAGLIDPIAQYGHSKGTMTQGQAVIGGLVYRGTAIPQLAGKYVFGDYLSTQGLLVLDQLSDIDLRAFAGGTSTPSAQESIVTLTPPPSGLSVFGFARDEDGEVYVLGNTTGTPTGQTGELRKFVPTIIQ
ncbi:MAG: glucose/sorbosone dehydrogenase [Myxococcaceae bacterium]|nr:glucose/sorbosone dehydrogenase [Myxococcaceae bacterium]